MVDDTTTDLNEREQRERNSEPPESVDGPDEQSDGMSMTRRGVIGAAGAAAGAGLFSGVGVAATESWNPHSCQTYDPHEHAHDGEVVTRGTYKIKNGDVYRNTEFGERDVVAVHKSADQRSRENHLHVHVHGFNTPQESATSEFDAVAEHFPTGGQADDITHLGFSWDSFGPSWWKLDARYKWVRTRTIARSNGKRLSEFLANQRREREAMNIFLTGYSLGSQVCLEAIRHHNQVWADERQHIGEGLISGFYLVGAATPKVSTVRTDPGTEPNWKYYDYEHNQNTYPWGYGKDIDNVLRYFPHEGNYNGKNAKNFHSKNDPVLGASYVAGDNHYALGRTGMYPQGSDTYDKPNASRMNDRDYASQINDHGHWPTNDNVWNEIKDNINAVRQYRSIPNGGPYVIRNAEYPDAVLRSTDDGQLRPWGSDYDSGGPHWEIDSHASLNDGIYCRIKSHRSGKCLDVNEYHDDTPVELLDWSEHETQQWKFEYVGDGEYRIVNRWDGGNGPEAIEVDNWGTNDVEIETETDKPDSEQHWYIEYQG